MNPAPETQPHHEAWPLDQAGRAMLLRMTRLSVWLGIPITAFSLWQTGTPFGAQWTIVFGLATSSIASHALVLRQRHGLAVTVFLWGALMVLLAQCLVSNGVRSPAAVMLPLLLVLCGGLRGPRHTYAMSMVILAALSAMALFDPHIWTHAEVRPAFSFWIGHSFAVVVCTLFAVHVAHNLRRQREQVQTTDEELRRRIAELQTARNKFQALFNFSPTPVSVTLVSDGTYQDVNPAWERASGWSRQEVLGKTSAEIGLWVTPEERVAWVSGLVEQGRLSGSLVRFQTRQGDLREFLSDGEYFDYDGKHCIFASFVDVTEQRKAEFRLRELNAELENRVAQRTQLLETANQELAATLNLLQRAQEELVRADTLASLGALVAGVAHELNTPLGSAVLIASTFNDDVNRLKRELAAGALRKSSLNHFVDEASQACALLGSSLQRARDLVNSFKTVAMDQSSERRRTFDLAEVLSDTLQTLAPGFKHRPIALHSTLATGLDMDSYPGPVSQVLSNLVQNAVMHGLNRAEGGLIEIVCKPLDEERVVIEVSDNGTGIPADHIAHIFDPFFTTRLADGGNGLGLSIVRSLVSSTLGGSISVHSDEGEGARFSVILPRVAPSHA